MEHNNDTIYFVGVGSKETMKKSEIEDKLGLSTFNRLHFFKCNLAKAYTTTFSYLVHNHHQITILEIINIDNDILSKISQQLSQFLTSSTCENLIKLSIRSNDGSSYNLEELYKTLLHIQSLQCIQLENMEINPAIKLDKTLFKYLYSSSVDTQTLRILDLRNLKFSGKQNYDLAQSLNNCLKLGDINKKNKPSYACTISEFFFGGNDQWSSKGITLMCDFIKYNYNLEILGIELLHGPKDKPFVTAADPTAIGVFILSMDNHHSLQRLEIYHMQTYTLKMFGEQFEKRIQGKYIHDLSVSRSIRVLC